MRPSKWVRKLELPRHVVSLGIVAHSPDIDRDSVHCPTAGMNMHFYFTTVYKNVLVLFIGKKYFPVSMHVSFQLMRSPVPIIKVAGEIKLLRIGCPFPVRPSISLFIEVDTIVMMGFCKIEQASFHILYFPFYSFIALKPFMDLINIGIKPGVFLDDS